MTLGSKSDDAYCPGYEFTAQIAEELRIVPATPKSRRLLNSRIGDVRRDDLHVAIALSDSIFAGMNANRLRDPACSIRLHVG